MAKGTEIVQLDEVERALVDPTAKLSVLEEDPDVVAARIVQDILNSSDPLARSEAIGGREILGEPLHVTTVDWRNSDLDGEGLGIYAVLHATKQDGTSLAVTCGSRNVMAQVYRKCRDNAVPFDASFTESKPTARGRTVLWLENAKFEPGKTDSF